jgi:hypothetical protein
MGNSQKQIDDDNEGEGEEEGDDDGSPQPGGLKEGSRWSFRALPERPPVNGPRFWRTPARVPELVF